MLILGHFLSQQLPYDICCILGTGPSQMRPANCNMKQLTHLESKKRAHGFEQYVTNNIKESTFLGVSTQSVFEHCKTFSWKYCNCVIVKTKVYGSVISYRGWEQLEVTCNPIVHHGHNLWNVEGHENERGNNILTSTKSLHCKCRKCFPGKIASNQSFFYQLTLGWFLIFVMHKHE